MKTETENVAVWQLTTEQELWTEKMAEWGVRERENEHWWAELLQNERDVEQETENYNRASTPCLSALSFPMPT